MRLLVIGIDSASPHLIGKWIKDLPNLKSIFENGVHGILQSIVPPESVPAWQCFATGKNPAKIGVYGFTYIGRDLHLRHGRTTPEQGCFWDLCSRKGMKVGVFNVPGTYPPYHINGFMVSGFPVPPRKAWSDPRNLMKRLDEAVGGYEIDIPLTKPSALKGGEDAFLAQVDRLHKKSLKAAKLLVQWYDPEIFVMTLQGVDRIHHDFWKYMGDDSSPYHDVVHDWYARMDTAVGELRELVQSETNVLVLSDHGSAPVSRAVYVNEYLKRNGLLTLRHRVRNKGDAYTKLRNMLMGIVPPDLIAELYKITPGFISRNLTGFAAVDRILQNVIDNIDWSRTLAYSTGGHQAHIYINHDLLKRAADQPTNPSVSSIVDQLCGLMSRLTDPTTGTRLHPVFHFKESTFRGPYHEEAPDLCVELYIGSEKVQVNPRVGTDRVWSLSPHYSSVHSREGFWALAGPKVKAGLELDAGILDMTPTLLELLDIRGETGFDGRILDSIFAPLTDN